MIALDTHAPVITVQRGAVGTVHARVHDRISPLHGFDFRSVVLRANGVDTPMKWYGEYLWAAALPAGTTDYQVCATDRAGNMACASPGGMPGPDAGPGGDAGVIVACPDGSGKCPGTGCCDTGGDPRGLALLVLVSARILSRARRSGSAARRRRSA
jgi:hypothetical protein